MANNSCSVVLLELGAAAFDQGGSLVASKKFDNAVRSYRLLKSGAIPDEIRPFIEKLRPFDSVTTNDASVAAVLRQTGLNSQLMPEDQQQLIQSNKPGFIVKAGFANNDQDAMQALREFAINLSSSRVKEASEKLDLHIIQSINALDELDKIINTLGARMREWYGLHFPELDNLVQSLVAYAEIVSRAGLRENITPEILQSAGMQDKKVEILLDGSKGSRGGDMTPENLAIVKRLADQVIAQSDLRRVLADHIELAMETVAPNVKELLTASVGARIIARAGSLARLAMLPASTIQVLGAEKALFRALKTGARPPKHGIIFQYAAIHQSPRWLRGRIARAVAGKLAIAARMDAFGGANEGDKMRTALEKKLSDLKDRYQGQPPKKKHATQWRPPPQEVRRDLSDRGGRGRETRYPQPGPGRERLRRGNRQSWR